MNKQKKIGLNRIKAVIKSQGRNELWVAQQIGISKTSLSNYCSFLREPSLDVLFRISSILNVPVSDLINLEAKIDMDSFRKNLGTSISGEPVEKSQQHKLDD